MPSSTVGMCLLPSSPTRRSSDLQLRRGVRGGMDAPGIGCDRQAVIPIGIGEGDRKSTRLNSSHLGISYAVFHCRHVSPALFPYTTLFRSPTATWCPWWDGCSRYRL